jgi:hypothetical protein
MKYFLVAFFATLLVIVSLFATLPAWGQGGQCVDRFTALEYLEDKYSEERIAWGLAANGSVVELIVSASGSWSLLSTSTSGLTCLIASGERWEGTPPRPKGQRT